MSKLLKLNLKNELWEIEGILYLILGVLIQGLLHIVWIACIAYFFGAITFIGLWLMGILIKEGGE